MGNKLTSFTGAASAFIAAVLIVAATPGFVCQNVFAEEGVSTTGDKSPAVKDVTGDVVINYGVPPETFEWLRKKYDLKEKEAEALKAEVDKQKLFAEEWRAKFEDKVKDYEGVKEELDRLIAKETDPLKKDAATAEACLENGDFDCADKSIEEIKKGLEQDSRKALLVAYWSEIRNNHEQAKEYYEKAAALAPDDADINLLYGYFLLNNNEFQNASGYLNKAFGKYQEHAKFDPNKYNTFVALTLLDLARIYSSNNDRKTAEKALLTALNLINSLEERTILANLVELDVLNMLGLVYMDEGAFEISKDVFTKLLSIRRELAKEEPEEYLPVVAMTHDNLGVLYKRNAFYDEAKREYIKALDIWNNLPKEILSGFIQDYAKTINNLGNLYSLLEKYEEAEPLLKEALVYRRKLVELNPKANMPELAGNLASLGAVNTYLNKYEEAEEELKESIKLRENLARENPKLYLPELIETQKFLARMYKLWGKPIESMVYLTLAETNRLDLEELQQENK